MKEPVNRKKAAQPRDRIDLRADPVLIERVQAQAKRLGISLSGYIRQAVTRRVEQDEAEDPSLKQQRKAGT